MLQLELPNKSHKVAYEKLIREWEGMKAPSSFFGPENFDIFLENVNKDIFGVTGKVPAHLFFLIDYTIGDEIIGIIQIRHHIDHLNLIEAGGHIGYGIAPKYRRKGYATLLLQLALGEAKKLGLERVLVTCNIDNIGSNKVIQKNAGIFERKTEDGLKNRYWISL